MLPRTPYPEQQLKLGFFLLGAGFLWLLGYGRYRNSLGDMSCEHKWSMISSLVGREARSHRDQGLPLMWGSQNHSQLLP